jgi:hypothetical protein
MAAVPRNLPHLFIEGGGEKEPYTSHPGGGATKALPVRDRAAHAAKLSSELGAAVAAGRDALAQRVAGEPAGLGERSADQGFYLEFALEGPLAPDALSSLEDRRRGIELVAVRPATPDAPAETIATVFVPDRSADHFAKRIEEFKSKETKTGKPKNAVLVASISGVRFATPRSVFTDPADTFPEDPQQDLWWELWIRKGFEAQVDAAAQGLGIVVKPHVVRFPEREVKLVRATVTKLQRLMRQSDGVAELRRAKDTPAFFMRESNVGQAEWVEDLLSRLVPLADDGGTAVRVCLLDAGITRQHPLLNPRVDPADVLTVDPTWGTVDDAPSANGGGHGTSMAGLALYGDLTTAFVSGGSVQVPYRLESVKILPPLGANEPELYGAITTEAIGRAEAAAPNRHRVVCCAVTAEDSGQAGRPSSWSAAIDHAANGAFGVPRLIVVAAGNIRDRAVTWVADYLERNDTSEVENPGQAWNALTVGAATERLNITDPSLAGWEPVAPAGDLCPSSRTGLTFAAQWPTKPDVVLEGGNYAHDGGPVIDAVDDLQLLTTSHQLAVRLLTTFGDTSAAAALCANLAARIAVTKPALWPETVRALIVHSSEWSAAMLAQSQAQTGAAKKRVLLRRYGYGIPDLDRAIRSATNDLTLVVQDALHPFKLDGSVVKTNQMSIHELPWPIDVLDSLGETEVELRVTLSYFIEPNPGERGWARRHRYASHGLRFEVKHQLESDDAFRSRLSRAVESEDDAVPVAAPSGWALGSRARNSGSVHSDIWRGTAAELAQRGAIGVYPVTGWWREQKALGRYDNEARYSLIATIRVPDQEVDIYTPVSVLVGVPVQAIEIDLGS